MRIQHNIMAMSSYRNYTNNTSALSKNLEKLSSGFRINRAGDDAAGLAISEKMRAQITGLDAAQKNVKDGVSLVKTAEGALQEVQDMMNRMVYLATQSANGTFDDAVDRDNLQKEVDALKSEIDRIADSSNFNGKKLLNGELFDGLSNNYNIKGDNGGIDLNITVDAYTDKDGNRQKFTVKFEKVGSNNDQVEASLKDNEIVIKIGEAVELKSADDVAKAIKDIKVDQTDENAAAKAKALKTAFVSGEGVGKQLKNGGATVTTQPNMKPLVDNADSLTLQIGDTAENYNQLKVSIRDMHTAALGIDKVDISTLKGAQDAVANIKTAINAVSSTRGTLGAIQNRLEHTQNNLGAMKENIQDAESTIRDTDIADEMTSYTKNNILLQSAQAMLAQANQAPQGVLQLLQ